MKIKEFNCFCFTRVNDTGRIKIFLIEKELVSSKPNIPNNDNEKNRPGYIMD